MDALCSPPRQPLLGFHHSTVLDWHPACAEAPRNEASTSATQAVVTVLMSVVMSPVLQLHTLGDVALRLAAQVDG
jgi:hypothetical protein